MANCTCPIRPGMTYEQLRTEVLPYMCTPVQYGMCSTLTKEFTRATADNDRRRRAAQKLKAEGFSQEQIDNMPARRRRRGGTVQEDVPTLEFD